MRCQRSFAFLRLCRLKISLGPHGILLGRLLQLFIFIIVLISVAVPFLPGLVHLLEPPPQVFHWNLPSVASLLGAFLQAAAVSPGQVIDAIVELQLQPIMVLEVVLWV